MKSETKSNYSFQKTQMELSFHIKHKKGKYVLGKCKFPKHLSTIFTSDKVNSRCKNILNRIVKTVIYTYPGFTMKTPLSGLSFYFPGRTWNNGLSSRTYRALVTRTDHILDQKRVNTF